MGCSFLMPLPCCFLVLLSSSVLLLLSWAKQVPAPGPHGLCKCCCFQASAPRFIWQRALPSAPISLPSRSLPCALSVALLPSWRPSSPLSGFPPLQKSSRTPVCCFLVHLDSQPGTQDMPNKYLLSDQKWVPCSSVSLDSV